MIYFFYMLRLILFFGIVNMALMQGAVAREFRYPGQELVGTWRVVYHDLSEFKQVTQGLMDGLVAQPYFQPSGQRIEVTFDGIYETSGSVRGGTDKHPHPRVPQLIFRTIPPLSQSLCNFGVWKRAICENGRMPATEEVKSFLAVFVVPKDEKPRKRLVEWPNALPYEYFLWGEQARFNVRMLRDGRLLFMFVGGPENRTTYEEAGTVYSVWERVAVPLK